MPAAKKIVADVTKPGAPSIAPSASSRPIIIKHQTVKDPMMTETPAQPEPAAERETAPLLDSKAHAKKLIITPLHDSIETPVEVVSKAQPEPTPEPTPAPKPEPVVEPEPVESTTEAVKEAAPLIDEQQVAEDRAKTVSKLVASQQFFLPIETSEQRRSKRAVIMGSLVIILLALAWYDVALDAHLLSNSFNVPHSSFFSAK